MNNSKSIIYFLACCITMMSGMMFYSCKTDNRQITSEMIHFPGDEGSAEDAPVITFDSMTCRFGTISIGEKFNHTYRFTNTGKTPLIISQVNPSCGCTTPKDWPHDPIPPGGTGEISIEFNSKGNSGLIDKSISVLTNCVPKVWELKLNGMVSGVEADNKKEMPIEMDMERP